jgi:hypothetical protein
VLDEIAQLALGEPGTVVLAELAVADHLVGARAVAAEDAAQRRRAESADGGEERVARCDARLRAEIAAGQAAPSVQAAFKPGNRA